MTTPANALGSAQYVQQSQCQSRPLWASQPPSQGPRLSTAGSTKQSTVQTTPRLDADPRRQEHVVQQPSRPQPQKQQHHPQQQPQPRRSQPLAVAVPISEASSTAASTAYAPADNAAAPDVRVEAVVATPQMSASAVEAQKAKDGAQHSQVELDVGVRARIGATVCRILSPLGMGSFGVVWAAECDGFGEVAVKEILCNTQVELSRAMYEAQLLWRLGKAAEADGRERGEAVGRIPAYVASEVVEPSPGVEAYRVRFAMARLPGEPLDRFLQEQRNRTDALLSQPGGHAAWPPSRQISEAFRFARALVAQLAPTMARISLLAYHRDVNAHNILVSVDGVGPDGRPEPRYGLVDFGLAVDAERWRDCPTPEGVAAGDWRHLDVGGDCRYWPTSAWLQFEVGCYELANCPALCLEYQTHLDLQGLGITALQVLAEMLPIPTSSEDAGEVPAFFQRLQTAWSEYWETSTRYWSLLLDTFRNGGDWNALKHEFIAAGVHEDVSRKLQAVRAALDDGHQALKVCGESAPIWAADAQALYPALLTLISAGEDRGGKPTSWDQICSAIETTSPVGQIQSASATAVLPQASPRVGHGPGDARADQPTAASISNDMLVAPIAVDAGPASASSRLSRPTQVDSEEALQKWLLGTTLPPGVAASQADLAKLLQDCGLEMGGVQSPKASPLQILTTCSSATCSPQLSTRQDVAALLDHAANTMSFPIPSPLPRTAAQEAGARPETIGNHRAADAPQLPAATSRPLRAPVLEPDPKPVQDDVRATDCVRVKQADATSENAKEQKQVHTFGVGAHGGSAQQASSKHQPRQNLLWRLNSLASKVVDLAHAMEALETRDRELLAAHESRARNGYSFAGPGGFCRSIPAG